MITVLKKVAGLWKTFRNNVSLYLSDDIVNYLSKNTIYAMVLKVDIMDALNHDFKRKTAKSKKAGCCTGRMD